MPSKKKDIQNRRKDKDSEQKRRKKFVAFGELLLRLDPAGYNRFTQAGEFVARYTGGEANVAAALSQWGVECFAVSKVPSHEIGQACVNYLRSYGINTDGIIRGGRRLGILYVEKGASQRPSRVIYDREHSSFREIQAGEIDWRNILEGKDWLHFTGTVPALGPNTLRVLKDGLRTAKELNLTVSFDSNYRSALWGVEEARRILNGLMKFVDVFIGAHYDARALFGIDGEPAESAMEMQDRFGFKQVAYTLRRTLSASVNRLAGFYYDGISCHTSSEYEIQIVDRIGGGDAFSAGIIYGLLSGWNSQRTIEFAAASSCLKHSIPGDFNLVSQEEVEQVMGGENPGHVQR